MRNCVNSVQLVGRLGQDPEMVTFASGSSLVKLRLATKESYKDKTGKYNDVTQWHTVAAWGRLAERMATSLNKGQRIIVRGKLENRIWETKEGERRSSTQVKADEFALLDKKKTSPAIEELPF